MALNDKQERFCQEYIIDLNATQAAIRAGYSEKTAGSQGFDHLKKPEIQKRVQELQKERAERTQVTQDRVLQEYAKIAFLDIRKLYDENGNLVHITDLDDDTAAAIAGIDIAREGMGRDKNEDEAPTYIHKYKLIDKKGVLDSLARHLGMFEIDNKQRKSEYSLCALLGEIDGTSADLPEN